LKKLFLVSPVILAIYFTFVLVIFPQIYSNNDFGTAKPTLYTMIPEQAKLDEPFEITLVSNNEGAEADLQTVTVGFPQISNMDDIKIVSYDFLQSPKIFLQGRQIGSSYNSNNTPIEAKYPILEAYNRPSKTNHSSSMTIQIIPHQAGTFLIYTKTVTMPHTSEQSHFPRQGILDQQNEFVQEHKVIIIP